MQQHGALPTCTATHHPPITLPYSDATSCRTSNATSPPLTPTHTSRAASFPRPARRTPRAPSNPPTHATSRPRAAPTGHHAYGCPDTDPIESVRGRSQLLSLLTKPDSSKFQELRAARLSVAEYQHLWESTRSVMDALEPELLYDLIQSGCSPYPNDNPTTFGRSSPCGLQRRQQRLGPQLQWKAPTPL